MIIGVARFSIFIPGAQSLKDKRHVMKAIINQVQHRFNVAIAEVDGHDQWQAAELGVVCISTSADHADAMLQEVAQFIERRLVDGYVADVHTELIPMG